jgi:hypothetical protein
VRHRRNTPNGWRGGSLQRHWKPAPVLGQSGATGHAIVGGAQGVLVISRQLRGLSDVLGIGPAGGGTVEVNQQMTTQARRMTAWIVGAAVVIALIIVLVLTTGNGGGGGGGGY